MSNNLKNKVTSLSHQLRQQLDNEHPKPKLNARKNPAAKRRQEANKPNEQFRQRQQPSRIENMQRKQIATANDEKWQK